jgi:two-component system, LytTR family, sensor kinase
MSNRHWIFALFTAVGLLHFVYRTLEYVVNGHPSHWQRVLVEEMSGAYGAMVLVPWVLWVLGRERWWWHLPGMVVYSVVKTSLMWGARELAFWGNYDYGLMPLRYLMEFPVDVIGYAITAGAAVFLQRQSEMTRIKMENLNLQLQPHFLFNAMNAVSATVYEDPRRADLMLSRLAEYLRRTLQRGDTAEAPLEQELEMLEVYLHVMRARFEEGLAVSVVVDPAAQGAMVPQGLLQPVVENAIRHGGAGRVEIRVEREGGRLRLRVTDEGRGTGGQGLGIGLKNTQERLRHLYGAQGEVSLTRRDEGTEVTVGIPCRVGG